MNMRKWLRVISLTLVAALMLTSFTACDNGGETDDGTLANGNVITAKEEGSEAELTAVRENLIKATETKGLGEITKMEFYENGVRTTSDQYVLVKDNKKFYYADGIKRLVNYPDGYILDMPEDWVPDFTLATARCVFSNDEVTLSVTDESDAVSTYNSVDLVLEYTFQYIRADEYIEKNRLEKLKEETIQLNDEMNAYILKLKVNDTLEGTKNYYTYVAIYNELKLTLLMFKAIDDRDFADVYNTYQSIYDKGAAVDTVAYPEGGNPNWAPETKELYDSIMNTDHVIWGMFNGNIDNDPLELKYPITEKQVDHKFELISSYTDEMTYDFPVDKAQAISDDDRFLQFTFHYQYQNGEQVAHGLAPSLNVYRGELDEEFREMARNIVEYGKPMLFRINNEMNSDWTLWSFVNTLLDPDIFTETWIRLYNILEEEGANKYLIYVWNPQDCNTYPMTSWNDLRLYFPGAKYVHMLGLTAYNFGDDTKWDTFPQLYQPIEDYYTPLFGDWGWVISEFGCSDMSTDPANENRKAEWIKEMFDCFEAGEYPNIKAAVWFNTNDYNPDGSLLHEISIGRDVPAQEAFKDGLDRTQ